MCRKYPGRRCGNPIHERVESLVLQLEEAKAFRDVLDPDETKRSDLTDANRRVTVLEARLKAAQAKYDSTDAGFAVLEAAAEDKELSRDERNAIKVRLKDAAKDRAARAKVVSDSEARRANVMAYLEEAGVPAVERAEFNDTNIYLAASGSAKHYETIKNNRMRAYETRLAEYNRALTKAQTPADIAKVKENAGLAVEKAKTDYNAALYVYDSTSAGLGSLRAKVAKASICYTVQDEVKLAKLELRLGNAEKAHRLNLDYRNLRTEKLARLRAVVSAHGGDVAGAVEAFKNKNPLPKSQRNRVPDDLRASKVHAHLTQNDLVAIDRAFKQSDEYKAGGEDARTQFIKRRVLTPPHELYSRESFAEVDARTVLGSNGKTGRNHTVLDLSQGKGIPRNQMMSISLTKRESDAIKSKSSSAHTSNSALLRALLLGENPVAHENDRSARARNAKRVAYSERLMNSSASA